MAAAAAASTSSPAISFLKGNKEENYLRSLGAILFVSYLNIPKAKLVYVPKDQYCIG